MSLETAFEIVFAAGVVLAAAALAGAALEVAERRMLVAVAGAIGASATAAWVAFALEPGTGLAIAATGLVACLVAVVAALGIRRGLEQARAIDSRDRASEVGARGGRSAGSPGPFDRARADTRPRARRLALGVRRGGTTPRRDAAPGARARASNGCGTDWPTRSRRPRTRSSAGSPSGIRISIARSGESMSGSSRSPSATEASSRRSSRG